MAAPPLAERKLLGFINEHGWLPEDQVPKRLDYLDILERKGWIRIDRTPEGGYLGAFVTPLGAAAVRWNAQAKLMVGGKT